MHCMYNPVVSRKKDQSKHVRTSGTWLGPAGGKAGQPSCMWLRGQVARRRRGVYSMGRTDPIAWSAGQPHTFLCSDATSKPTPAMPNVTYVYPCCSIYVYSFHRSIIPFHIRCMSLNCTNLLNRR
jgi:hypothetical protein